MKKTSSGDEMKLIDLVPKEDFEIKTEIPIKFPNGQIMNGWFAAKPLNYKKGYFSNEEKKEMKRLIDENKAIVVSYMEDIPEEERYKYAINLLGNPFEDNFGDDKLNPIKKSINESMKKIPFIENNGE